MMIEKFYWPPSTTSRPTHLPFLPIIIKYFIVLIFHWWNIRSAMALILSKDALLIKHFLTSWCPATFQKLLLDAQQIINKHQFEVVENNNKAMNLPLRNNCIWNFFRYHYKKNMLELLDIYFRLDAWYGMAMAVNNYGLISLNLWKAISRYYSTDGLYHILLQKPVAMMVLHPQCNFFF